MAHSLSQRINIRLRAVIESDLDAFFEFQLDPEANQMAAFVARDPTDKTAFLNHWKKDSVRQDSYSKDDPIRW